MTGNNEKEFAGIRVKDQVQNRTPDLLRSPRFHFARDSVANYTVNPTTCRIVSKANGANRGAIQECVPGRVPHDEFAVGVMDESWPSDIRLLRYLRIVRERTFGKGRRFQSVQRPA